MYMGPCTECCTATLVNGPGCQVQRQSFDRGQGSTFFNTHSDQDPAQVSCGIRWRPQLKPPSRQNQPYSMGPCQAQRHHGCVPWGMIGWLAAACAAALVHTLPAFDVRETRSLAFDTWHIAGPGGAVSMQQQYWGTCRVDWPSLHVHNVSSTRTGTWQAGSGPSP